MEFKVVIDKKLAFMVFGAILILAGAIYGYAQSGGVVSHNWFEIENRPIGLDDGDDFETDTRCDSSGECSQVCIGTDCQSSWPSGSGGGGTTVSLIDCEDVSSAGALGTGIAECPGNKILRKISVTPPEIYDVYIGVVGVCCTISIS